MYASTVCPALCLSYCVIVPNSVKSTLIYFVRFRWYWTFCSLVIKERVISNF